MKRRVCPVLNCGKLCHSIFYDYETNIVRWVCINGHTTILGMNEFVGWTAEEWIQ